MNTLKKQILVHAEGEVLAKTIYSHRIDEPIIKTIKEETGRTYTRREFKIGDKGVQFFKGEIPFKDYIEEVEEVKPFNIDVDLPIKVFVHQYKEVEIKEIKQNIDFLKQASHIRAVEELNKQLPKDIQIQSKDVKYYLKDDILSTYVTLEVIEDIGKKEVIYGN